MLAGKPYISLLLVSLFSLALAGCTKGPVAWWSSVNEKARRFSELEAKYEALAKEHEALKRDHYRLMHEHDELLAEVKSRRRAEASLAATGSRTGRDPAAVGYKAPHGLTPQALLALGYEHLREKRFGEAAVTFESLLTSPEGAAVQGADLCYSAGIAWFQLGNFKKARESFEAALAHAEADEKERVRKKVELWRRVIDRKLASEGDAHGGKHE